MKVKYVKDEVYPVYDIGFKDWANGEIEIDSKFAERFDEAMTEFWRVQELFKEKLREQDHGGIFMKTNIQTGGVKMKVRCEVCQSILGERRQEGLYIRKENHHDLFLPNIEEIVCENGHKNYVSTATSGPDIEQKAEKKSIANAVVL